MRASAFLLLGVALLSLGCAKKAAEVSDVSRGEEIFLRTPTAAKRFVPTSALACGNCHSHASRVDTALSLVRVADRYPQMSKRDGRVNTLQDRIRGCFLRSLNGIAPSDDSEEMRLLVAWCQAQREGAPAPPAMVSEAARRPLKDLDAKQGQRSFQEKCTACHGMGGEGAGAFPPLWGPRSYNDGAGLGRVYTLGAFIHNAMPLGQAGTIAEDEALDIALYIDSQPRPTFDAKKSDYPGNAPPVDAIYYLAR